MSSHYLGNLCIIPGSDPHRNTLHPLSFSDSLFSQMEDTDARNLLVEEKGLCNDAAAEFGSEDSPVCPGTLAWGRWGFLLEHSTPDPTRAGRHRQA